MTGFPPVHPDKGGLGIDCRASVWFYTALHIAMRPPSPCWRALPSPPAHTEDKLAHIFSAEAKIRAEPRQVQPSSLSSTILVTIYICWWESRRLFSLLKTSLKPTAQQKLHVCPGFASRMEEGSHSYGGAEAPVLFDDVPANNFNMLYFKSTWDYSSLRNKQYWTSFLQNAFHLSRKYRVLQSLPDLKEMDEGGLVFTLPFSLCMSCSWIMEALS